MSARAVAVTGSYQAPARTNVTDRSLEEMIFEAAEATLDDAGLRLRDVDSIVISAYDQTEGRVISSMVTAGAAGAVGRDMTMVASAAEHAFVYGYLRLLAGESRRTLILSWSKPSESLNPEHAELVAAEPFFLRPIGMNDAIAAGLQASAYRGRHGAVDDAAREVVLERRRAASANPRALELEPLDDAAIERSPMVCWPLRRVDIPVRCDLACGAVLVAEDALDGHDRPVAWIRGAGWATERYDMGQRDLSRLEALERAADRAYAHAGITSPRDEVDAVEVHEFSSVAALAARDALGLGAPDASGAGPAINPSGGTLATAPPFAAGLVRFVEAARQVQGRAGAHQLQPAPEVAVGAAVHGFAGQGAAAVVFDASRERAMREAA